MAERGKGNGGQVIFLHQRREERTEADLARIFGPTEPEGHIGMLRSSMEYPNMTAAKLVYESLYSEDGVSRKAALEVLVERKEWQSLILCVSSADPAIKESAIGSLKALTLGEELLEYFKRMEDAQIRQNITKVMENDVDRLMNENRFWMLAHIAYHTNDDEMKAAVVEHFKKKGNIMALEHLAVSSHDAYVKRRCLSALEPHFKRYCKNLNMLDAFAMDSESPELRIAALVRLHRMGWLSTVQVISQRCVFDDTRALAGKLYADSKI